MGSATTHLMGAAHPNFGTQFNAERPNFSDDLVGASFSSPIAVTKFQKELPRVR